MWSTSSPSSSPARIDPAPVRSRARLLLAAITAFGMLITACTSPRGDLLPPPSSTSSTAPAPTTEPDRPPRALEPLPGETTVPPLETEGRATIRGSVSGPDGGVAGALVRIQRLVGGQVQQIDVRTDENGGFARDSLPGGRFRVRAFLEPALTMTEPEIFWLPDGDDRDVHLTLERFDETVVSSSTTPPSPIVGEGVNLAVRVARQSVDGNGVVHQSPVPGVRVRVSSSGWTPLGQPVAVTDGGGIAVFRYRCDRAGSVTASATIGADPALAAPDEPDDGDDGDDGIVTTTSTTTTTTTAPDDTAGGSGEQQTVSLEVPACAPRPTTTTTTTTTTTPEDGGGDEDEGENGDPDTTEGAPGTTEG